jgi:hypothetical protein
VSTILAKKWSVTRGVSHCGLAIYILEGILRKKKNYENSNISPCKIVIFKISSTKSQNPSRY